MKIHLRTAAVACLLATALLSANAGLAGAKERDGKRPPQTSKKTSKGDDVFGYGKAFARALARLGPLSLKAFRRRFAPKTRWLSHLSWDPTKAKFFTDFQRKGFALDGKELSLFKTNGFVVSGRRSASNFAEIYYRIYNRDLPVFITADSLLHAWHRSYDAVLEELEQTYLSASLEQILSAMSQKLGDARRLYGQGVLGSSVADADYFLTVARSLLAGKRLPTAFGTADARVTATLAAVKTLKLQRFHLFGRERVMDFSQFKVRGHYEKTALLRRYFRAMIWLGRIDLRVCGEEQGVDYKRQLGSAIVLHDLLRRAGLMTQWRQFDRLLQTFVGRTDSMTFDQLSGLLEAGGVKDPKAVTLEVLGSLQQKLARGTLGLQQIRSHYVESSPFGPDQGSLPRSFTVMGQKFVVDSWATSKIVADDILWHGKKVQRRIPSALDVAFSVLRNDAVTPLIADRIADRKGRRFRDGLFYQHNLAALRLVFDQLPQTSWSENIYMSWLGVLRELSRPHRGKGVPQVARTRAWAMRELTTQLASWTQLRHDTILYVKQSYTSGAGCFYPAGYVDPRPVFWARFETMARRTARLLSKTPYPRRQIGPVDLQALKKRHVAFFTNFAEKLALIHGIAVKQMAQKPLDASQSRILKDVVQIHHGSGFTRYDGWYPTLFYGGAMDCGKADPIVADVHTDVPAPILGDPGGVLHQGVGRVDLMMVAIDNGKDKMVYAGPVSSHYEFILDGVKRKSDSEWKKELQSGKTPPRPSWTREYLVP